MLANVFYQHHAEHSLPLFLVTQDEWTRGLDASRAEDVPFLNRNNFSGLIGETYLIYNQEGIPIRAYCGAGKGNYVLALANAAQRLPAGCYSLQQDLPTFALVTWALAQYRFDHYKQLEILSRILVLPEEKRAEVCIEASAIFLIRDLINSPTNAMGPKELADVVAGLAKDYGAEFEQWVGDELLKANFPATHMVGRASANLPRLLCLTWGDNNHPKVSLVGKGVCFDTGGLDIKPAAGMRLMKKDMGGAAHVIGLAQWIMAKRIPIHLQVLIPAVENAIGPDAFRPGDVVRMRNGLSVEIDNTDAEGRLVLADALVKAGEELPELIIDFATLTGAARVALGTDIAAMFTNDDKLALDISTAANEVGDPLWRLPLFDDYDSLLESSVADVINASPSLYAGAITAALFLRRFVPDNVAWAHFDIMAWNAASRPGKPEGGEALGMRAIAEYLEKKYGLK